MHRLAEVANHGSASRVPIGILRSRRDPLGRTGNTVDVLRPGVDFAVATDRLEWSREVVAAKGAPCGFAGVVCGTTSGLALWNIVPSFWACRTGSIGCDAEHIAALMTTQKGPRK